MDELSERVRAFVFDIAREFRIDGDVNKLYGDGRITDAHLMQLVQKAMLRHHLSFTTYVGEKKDE